MQYNTLETTKKHPKQPLFSLNYSFYYYFLQAQTRNLSWKQTNTQKYGFCVCVCFHLQINSQNNKLILIDFHSNHYFSSISHEDIKHAVRVMRIQMLEISKRHVFIIPGR